MAKATSQQSGSANLGNPELSNIDYSRMCEQLRSLQNTNKVPEQYRQALNEAVAVLSNSEMEIVFRQEIQPRSGLRSQTMAASSGQGASLNTGRSGEIGLNPGTRRSGDP